MVRHVSACTTRNHQNPKIAREPREARVGSTRAHVQFCAGELASDSSNDACLSWLTCRAWAPRTWISCRMPHVAPPAPPFVRALSTVACWPPLVDPLAHVAHVLHMGRLDPLAHVAHVLHMGARPPGSRGSRAPPGARPPALCRRPSGDPKVQRRFCFRNGRHASALWRRRTGQRTAVCALDGHTDRPTTRRVRRGADTARATDPWGRTQGGGAEQPCSTKGYERNGSRDLGAHVEHVTHVSQGVEPQVEQVSHVSQGSEAPEPGRGTWSRQVGHVSRQQRALQQPPGGACEPCEPCEPGV